MKYRVTKIETHSIEVEAESVKTAKGEAAAAASADWFTEEQYMVDWKVEKIND
jgi:hypothetical protein